MDELAKKLQQLRTLMKQFIPKTVKPAQLPELPKLKQPSMGSMHAPAVPSKMPGMSPKSKKDPRKVAQQIKNGHVRATSLEMLKFNESGQWSLQKASDDTTLKIKVPDAKASSSIDEYSHVNSKLDGFGYNQHRSPDQHELIHGLNIVKAQPLGNGISGAAVATSKSHPHKVIIKKSKDHPNRVERGHDNLSSSKREVLYHNMAKHFFDMGKHVPTTSGFEKNGDEYSAQKMIDGTHVELDGPSIADKNHAKAIKDAHSSGKTHKLAIMDNIMGHHDRHRWNYMLDKDNEIHLIDNGTSFDYKNFDPNTKSHFHRLATSKSIKDMGHDDSKLHPEAEKWLKSLDENKAKDLFADQSQPQDSEHVKGFLTRLNFLKERINKPYKDVSELLEDSRISSGPMHEHHSDKKVA